MIKKADSNQINNRHYNVELWVGIRTFYESATHPNYEKIKSMMCAEFNLDTFPSQRTVERHAVKKRWIRYEDEIINKVAPNKYSDDFWLCVRKIHESNPKTTYKRLKELVQNELKCNNFPSQQAIANKAKHEGWERSDSLLKESDATLKKLIRSVKKIESENVLNEDLNNKEKFENQNLGQGDTVIDVDSFDFIKEIVECKTVNIKNLLTNAQIRRKSQAEVIVKSRKRMALNNDFGDRLYDNLVMTSALLMSDKIRCTFTKPMMKQLKDQLNTLCQILEVYNNFSFNRRESIKFELSLYGTQLEDLKDMNDTKRGKDLNDDKAYEAQQLRLVAEAERLAARRRYIDSGGVEEEVNTEMERRMKAGELDGSDADDQVE
ncbi:hypothetical protein AY606_08230 [Acinetobacter sp. SFB]|uniref:hypothetical protein n=1 Tax=Acinetobacter sp. SFB TaxID=1805634 RepID=UPI0007D843F6|nr:hypothetical protein [Acinetobacter sp. SFB]OAL78411.1 hypothetical protein AY606_08230 [Acinetobacter sp. SFB]